MYFPNTTLCISSLLMATASASTPTSFALTGEPAVETTTLWETSTHYLTSAITVTLPSGSGSSPSSLPAVSTVVASSSFTITPSLYVSGNTTLVPVTLWEGTTTRVIYPQNSTAPALETGVPTPIPTGYPANETAPGNATAPIGTSTVVLTTSVSKTTSSKDTATASASATVSEVPVNGAGSGKAAGNAAVGLGFLAGLMTML